MLEPSWPAWFKVPDTHAVPEPIAIVGIGCRLPGGVSGPESFWELLRDGRDAIQEVPQERWSLERHFDPDPQRPLYQHVRHGGFVEGIDQFDPGFFGISPREAICMDPQQRLLLEVAWQALEDACIPREEIRGERVSVVMGISSSDYSSQLWISQKDYAIPDNEPFILPGNTGCIAANRLSYFFDFKGPSFTVDTACSSSLVAVHLACESIWRGEAEAALAGGVQAMIQPGVHVMFCKAGLLSPDGRCKSFDAAANGYVRSEGAGAVLLKPLQRAQRDGDSIYAVIRGTAVNSDGRSNGMVAPNLRAQIACVRAAFQRAGIAPGSAQYVEAHGTGTRQGDPIELRALGTVLGEGRAEDQPCRVGSVKTNLGHSETAAGITGLIKAALCVHHRQIPPSLHFRTPNPSIDFQGLKLQVQTRLEPFPRADAPAVVGVSSFGFGGTNAHVVLEDAPPQPAPPRYGRQLPLQLFVLSARTQPALRDLTASLLTLLQRQPQLSLEALCATANQGRSQFSQRITCLAPDRGTLIQQLEAFGRGQELPGLLQGQASRMPGKLAFLFTGQGSQAPGMARALYDSHPVFREAFDRCTAFLDPLLEEPLAGVIFPAPEQRERAAERLAQTGFTQPALFAVGYALSQLWISWGVRPDLVLGHSVGEVVAAHLAGVFSLEDALRLIAGRGRLMQALPAGGGMLAVLAAREQVDHQIALLNSEAAGLSIAAINGPANIVVAGAIPALEALEVRCGQSGLQCQRLVVSHAFHSPAMVPMLAAFEQLLGQIRFSPPRIPIVSNVTGGLIGAEIATPEYWCEHVISPVRFAEGMAAASGVSTFVELGARPTLIGMGRQCLPPPQISWLPSLRPGAEDLSVILDSLARLHLLGHPIDWRGFHRSFPQRRLRLPGYPFQRQRYWWTPLDQGDGHVSLWRHFLFHKEESADPVRGATPAVAETKAIQSAGELQALDLPGGCERRFSTWLSSAEPGDLNDHRIRDQVVFPAAGFLVLALQALLQLERPLHLAGLELESPLRLHPAFSQLQLVVGQEGIAFYSRDGAEGPWRQHGQTAASDPAALSSPPPFRPDVTPREGELLDLPAFYEALRGFGLNYGPAFRGLNRLVRHAEAPERAWASLERPAAAGDWALLDACFQAVAATLDPQASTGQLLLPVGVEEIQLSQLPLPERFACQVQLRPSDEPAYVRADLVLHAGDDAEPVILGWLRGFRLRRLPRQALEWLFPQPEVQSGEPPPAPEASPFVQLHWLAAAQGDGPLPATQTAGQPPDTVRWLWFESSDARSLESRCAELLSLAQQALAASTAAPDARVPVWLVLEGDGASAHALAAMARSAALESPRCDWFTLWLPAGARRDGLSIPWERIRPLAEQEASLAFDGEQLLVPRVLPLHPQRFRYTTSSFGLLESLQPGRLPEQAPARGELELAVEATGLNFRDVLNALGLLRSYSRQLGMDEAARVPFGGECVGRVVAVGDGVDPALIGQRVLAALAVGSLASHVICREELCVPLPPQLSVEVGASISTAFLTALYGLRSLAGLRPGETVLIHAAAGGVGQAAVQVAQRLGARIIATASESKHQLLLDQGVAAVFDSRSTDFADRILQLTEGRGVEVVLNSLKGEWVDASFRALAQGGRFVELGKIEIWTREQAAERRPDSTYLPFDLLEVAAAEPALVRQLLLEILSDFVDGRYQPLRLQGFPIERSVEAFRLMAQSRHVGKVVIRQQPRPPADGRIQAQATYLLTGAFGGIGQRLCDWLIRQGVDSLLLVARPGGRQQQARAQWLDSLRDRGVTVHVVTADLGASAGQAEPALECLRQALVSLPLERPLKGIFHAAGFLDDGLLASQTPERLAAVMAPKLRGWTLIAQALDAAGIDPPLVVQFSSMAALIGSPGQMGYSAANGALDGGMQAAGRPGWMSLQWGPWAGEGMAAELDGAQQRRLQALGLKQLEPERGLNLLESAIARAFAGPIGVIDADWSLLARQAPQRHARALELLVAAPSGAGVADAADTQEPSAVVALRQTPMLERHSQLVRFVQAQLAKVMGIQDSAEIDAGEPLFNMGLDSLMALELMSLLEQSLGIRLTEALVFEHPTIEALASHFLEVLFADEPEAPLTPAAADASGQEDQHDASQPAQDAGETGGRLAQEMERLQELDAEELMRQLRQ